MNESQRNEIISRWRAGSSIRQIARELRLARNTVRGALDQIQAQRAGTGDGSTVGKRPSRLDSYEPVIRDLLTRYPDLTAVRLLEELARRGFTGGYTVVRQRLAALRPHAAPVPVIRFETAPGHQAQMDYAVYDLDFTGEGRRRVNLFSYILGYSRRQYLRFVEAQDLTTTLREHVRAFEHLGGVAATCLYDNMKVVVSGHADGVPIYNPRFLAFATHYGFRPIACRVRRPQTKGKVERPFSYVDVRGRCSRHRSSERMPSRVMTGSDASRSHQGASIPPAKWLVACIIAASLRSCSVTSRPALANSKACHAPAMPAPMMDTGDSPRGATGECPRCELVV